MSVTGELQRIRNAKYDLNEKALYLELTIGDGTPYSEIGYPTIDDIADAFCAIERRDSTDLSVVDGDGAVVELKAGYYAENYQRSVVVRDLNEPTITVSEDGLITAVIEQPEGYVRESDNDKKLQLPTMSGGVFTPAKDNTTIVEAGTYVTGDVVVAPITDKYLDITDTANHKDSDDLSVRGETVFVSPGYYPNEVHATVNMMGNVPITVNALNADSNGVLYQFTADGFVNTVTVTLGNELENALKEI